ncbi:MAG TPA: CPBP family intramembrane metalloprotease [Bacteroidales bacterium]|nr:CPBP family intramembrane metalloprotease [Bacteroidales bacterium]
MKPFDFLRRYPPYSQLICFIFITLASLMFTLFLGLLIGVPFFGMGILNNLGEMANLSNPLSISLLKYLQIINQLGMFIFPPIFFAWIISDKPSSYLNISVKPKIYTLFTAGILMFLALPLINYFSEINSMMKLPHGMAGIENWMKDSEKNATQLTDAFLNVKNGGGFAVNMLMIAILPAIGEELVFRGVLLRLLKNWIKNIHWAIVVSAIIFSAFHLQFYGFIPRLMLGILFGYLCYWTGSLWVPIFVHFVNNGTTVVVSYLSQTGLIQAKAEELGSTSSIPIILGSLIASSFLIASIYYFEKKSRNYFRL